MTAESSAAGYPVRFDIAYPEGASRWKIFFRWILAIPHLVIVQLLGPVVQLLTVIALFAIVLLRRYPAEMFTFAVGCLRWKHNTMTYVLFHDGPYPPFSFDAGSYPHLTFEVSHREKFSRFLPLVKWLLATPHYVVLTLLALLAFPVWLFAALALLVTGTFPRGAFTYLVGVGRWAARVEAYVLLLVDEYPPFSLRP